MAILSFTLDPNAQSYSNDDIITKINSASTTITRASAINSDSLVDGSTNKVYTSTEQTKLSGIENNATADMTGNEMITSLNSASTAFTRESILSQANLKIVKTNPTAGEHLVYNIHRQADGRLDVEYESVSV